MIKKKICIKAVFNAFIFEIIIIMNSREDIKNNIKPKFTSVSLSYQHFQD